MNIRGITIASVLITIFSTIAPSTSSVVMWSDGGASQGCVYWSALAFEHYGINYTKVYKFNKLIENSKYGNIIYIPGGWHPEHYWPKNWKETLLSKGYLKYMGVCAGAYTLAIGGARYYPTYPTIDYWKNGITVQYGMLGPGIWSHYKTYVIGNREGWILYWNGPLFMPEPNSVIVGPSSKIKVPAFYYKDKNGLYWAWVLDMKVNVAGVEGWGLALGIIYEPVELPSGTILEERGRIALFGPHPEFSTKTWWMIKKVVDFLNRKYTPSEFEYIKENIKLRITSEEKGENYNVGPIPVIPIIPTRGRSRSPQ